MSKDYLESMLPHLKVVDKTYGDVDQLSEAMVGINPQLTQLSRGSFQGQLTTIGISPGLHITRIQINQAVQAIGDKPPESLMFALPLQPPAPPTYAHDIPLNPQVIFGFDARRPVRLVLPPTGYHHGHIAVSKALFQHYAAMANRYDLDEAFLARNIITPAGARFNPLRNYVQQLFHFSLAPSALLPHLRADLVEQDLLPLLINALPHPDEATSPRPYRRAEIITAAQTYMVANLHRPITLADICQAASASERSLQYGFQDLFGMGPMAFLKVQRLHGIRRVLKTANPTQQTISHIARDWGFFSMGHFARDYKALFGETPSQTLPQ
ncbi:MAG: helix-turn-helix domain-containing protein [Leptolyngbyaceae cyanobacterium SM2_5_2]|nr:helix-turn-helix domain-containing protein [Leptolyngbyaceae cyanobacterium SM2_5_2]